MYTQKSIPFNKSEVHYSIQKSSEKGVVFYHGDGQNHTAGNSILELFPDQYTKVSIDRPGHGKSPFLTGRTIEKECEILETIVGKEGIKDPVVIGHSSGAVIAASFAMRNKLQALILLNPFFMNPRKLFWYLPASLLEKMYLNQAKGKHNPNAPYHIFGNERSEEDIHREAFVHTPHETLQQNLALFEGYDVRRNMQHIDVPILILQSRKGLLSTHSHVRRVCKDIPNVRIESIDGTHNIHLLSKQEVEEKIKKNMNFLRL